MAKFSLTINTDDAQDVAAVVAALGGAPAGGNVAAVNAGLAAPAAQEIVRHAAPVATDDGDDDNEPANAAAPELDSAGLPWDERIHAASKGVKADGTWRARRGVSDDLVKTVEAELRARVAGPVASNPPAQSMPGNGFPPPNQFGQAAPLNAPGFPPNAPAASAPPAHTPDPQADQMPPFTAPTQAPPAQTPPQSAPVDFMTVMTALQGAMQRGQIDQTALATLAQEISSLTNRPLAQITDLSQPHNADMLDWVMGFLRSKGLAQ